MEPTITIVGNLTDDPELRYTTSGAAVCKFTVAHNPRVKRGDEWVDGEPTFYPVTVWRQLAENAAETFQRGHRVIVHGRIRTERWEDKATGDKRSRMVVDADAAGPDLSWATATVKKMSRNGSPADDEWNSASRQRPNPAPGSGLAPGKPTSDQTATGQTGPEGSPWDEEPPF